MRKAKRKLPAHYMLALRIGMANVTSEHVPGSIIPRQIELLEGFGVSRGVHREARRALASKGFVERRPKAGTRVRERPDRNFRYTELLGWMVDGVPSLPFVRSLFQPQGLASEAGRADDQRFHAIE